MSSTEHAEVVEMEEAYEFVESGEVEPGSDHIALHVQTTQAAPTTPATSEPIDVMEAVNTRNDGASEPAHIPSQVTTDQGPKKVDLLIGIDCTGSMGAYINKAREVAGNVVRRMHQEGGVRARVAIAGYRDYCDVGVYEPGNPLRNRHAGSAPTGVSWLTKHLDFTEDVERVNSFLAEQLKAGGGGDTPEAVEEVLRLATTLSWSDGGPQMIEKPSTKLFVIITDARPHGLEGTNARFGSGMHDDWPNGADGLVHPTTREPMGGDPLMLAHQLKHRGVRIYAVLAQEPMSSDKLGRDFYAGVCKLTGGQAINLNDPTDLEQALLGSALESADDDDLVARMEQELRTRLEQEPQLSQEDAASRVEEHFTQAPPQVRRLVASSEVEDTAQSLAYRSLSTLADVRAMMSKTVACASPVRGEPMLEYKRVRTALRRMEPLPTDSEDGDLQAKAEEHYAQYFDGVDDDEAPPIFRGLSYRSGDAFLGAHHDSELSAYRSLAAGSMAPKPSRRASAAPTPMASHVPSPMRSMSVPGNASINTGAARPDQLRAALTRAASRVSGA